MTHDTDDSYDFVHSPLERTLSGEGHTLRIDIYRGAHEPDWILEIEDETGTSTVFDEQFASDQAALDAALAKIEAEGGIHRFCANAQAGAMASEREMFAKLDALNDGSAAASDSAPQDLMKPLSEVELEALEHFLVHAVPIEYDGMTLDMLDGFLHALAIGPETVMPGQWLPHVWGLAEEGEAMPPVDSLERANQVLGLVMRHYNSIISHLESLPDHLQPIFGTDVSEEGEYEDAGMWAHGFLEGVKLSQNAWQPLLSRPEGQRWFEPLRLMGDDDLLTTHLEQVTTKAQVLTLNQDVVDSVLLMRAFWLPLRQAVAERHTAQAMSTKVGRNEPCPCGSGKKFKKCCGSPAELH
jgi:uncharacterized protein